MIKFKQIINNYVLRKNIFQQVQSIHEYLGQTEQDREKRSVYTWLQVYRSYDRLVQFGYLKELKERLETEDIDQDFYYHINNDELQSHLKKRKRVDYDIDEDNFQLLDHRIVGLSKIASERGYLDIIKYLDNHRQSEITFSQRDLVFSIVNQHFKTSKYLLDNRYSLDGFNFTAIEEACKHNNIKLLKRLLEKWNFDIMNNNTQIMNQATSIETLKLLYGLGFECNNITKAVDMLSLEMIEFINQHFKESMKTCTHNRMVIIKVLVNKRYDIIDYIMKYSPDWVALGMIEHGDVDVIKRYFHNSNTNNLSRFICTTDSIPMMEYLLTHHKMKFSSYAATEAAMYGKLEVLQFLHQYGGIKLDSQFYEHAARGHLNIIEYLHTNAKELDCPKDIIDIAASNGKLDIIKFLHQNRTEGCSKQALTRAIINNHIDVVQFLHHNRTEGFEGGKVFAWNLSIEMLKFLHLNRTEGLCFNHETQTITQPTSIETIQYIFNNYKSRINYTKVFHLKKLGDVELLEYFNKLPLTISVEEDVWRHLNNDILKYLIDNMLNSWDFKNSIDLIISHMNQFERDYTIERLYLVHKLAILMGKTKLDVIVSSLEALKYFQYFTNFTGYISKSFMHAIQVGNNAIFQFILYNHPDVKITFEHLETCDFSWSLQYI